MDLGSSYLKPGTVESVLPKSDDTILGTITCRCPGLFSVDDDASLLPPVIPFIGWGGSSSYSSLKQGDPVWIFHDKKNTQLFYYIKYNVLDENTKNLIEDGANIEVLFSRDTDKGLYQMFFSDGEGIKFLKDDNYIKISPKGNIDIVTENNNRSISLSSDSICLGASSEDAGSIKEHIAKGEPTEKCLQDIYNILTKLQTAASGNPYTANLSVAFTALPTLSQDISKVKSADVKTV